MALINSLIFLTNLHQKQNIKLLFEYHQSNFNEPVCHSTKDRHHNRGWKDWSWKKKKKAANETWVAAFEVAWVRQIKYECVNNANFFSIQQRQISENVRFSVCVDDVVVLRYKKTLIQLNIYRRKQQKYSTTWNKNAGANCTSFSSKVAKYWIKD